MVRSVQSSSLRKRSLVSEHLELRRLMAIDVFSDDLHSAADVSACVAVPLHDGAVPSENAQLEIAAAPLEQEFETFSSDEELKGFLIERAVSQYKEVLGKTLDYPPGGWWWRWGPVVFDGVDSPTAGNTHSDTNVQVAGVDEADLVETDGDYLYVLRDQELLIFDTHSAADAKLVSRTQLDVWATGMYLRGDRLTIIGANNLYYPAVGGPATGGIAADMAIWPGNFQSRTNITILDVSNHAAPETVRKLDIDGNYISSRSIDGKIVLIQQNSVEAPVPHFDVIDADGKVVESVNTQDPVLADGKQAPTFWQSGYKYRVESEESYRAHLQNEILGALPQFVDTPPYPTFAPPSPQRLLEATDIYKPGADNVWGLTTVTVIDSTLEEPTVVDSTAAFDAYASTIYVGANSVYLMENAGTFDAATNTYQAATRIRKFSLGEDGYELAAEGKVRGDVFNQFAVDEHDGYLRVATTQTWGGNIGNNVYVLQENGKTLDVVGKIEGLAPGERIFSTRFMGDTAYVVTFRQIDPLFTIDLSDPTAPVVRGELKLPGFSTYMQALNDQFLLGIGRDADPVTGRREEMQVTLFDVNDLANPRVQSQVVIPHTDWTWNDVESNHLAVGWYPEANVLALPVVQSRQGEPIDWNHDGVTDYFAPTWENSLQVFHVNFESAAPNSPQLVPLGGVEHDTQVLRSVRIGDELYSISRDSLKIVPLRDPTNTIREIYYGREFVGIQNDPDAPGSGTLMIMGSYQDDKIEVNTRGDGMIDVTINGLLQGSVDGANVRTISVDGNLGPDSVILRGASAALNVTGTNVESIVRPDRGDFNRDGKFDLLDFALLRQQFKQSGANLTADADGDGSVGIRDFAILRRNFNT